MLLNKNIIRLVKSAYCFFFKVKEEDFNCIMGKWFSRLNAIIHNQIYIEYHTSNRTIKNITGYPRKKEIPVKPLDENPIYDSVTINNINILKKLKPTSIKGNFLDIGCSSGNYLKVIKNSLPKLSKHQYFGIDYDKDQIKIARLHNPTGKFAYSSAQNIEHNNNFFETVFCSGTLQYTLLDWGKCIKEMFRVSSRYVVITRLPTINDTNSIIVEQLVRKRFVSEKRLMVVISELALEKLFKKMKVKIIFKGRGVEQGTIGERSQNFYFWDYILQKRS